MAQSAVDSTPGRQDRTSVTETYEHSGELDHCGEHLTAGMGAQRRVRMEGTYSNHALFLTGDEDLTGTGIAVADDNGKDSFDGYQLVVPVRAGEQHRSPHPVVEKNVHLLADGAGGVDYLASGHADLLWQTFLHKLRYPVPRRQLPSRCCA